jgi:hypothetical protein
MNYAWLGCCGERGPRSAAFPWKSTDCEMVLVITIRRQANQKHAVPKLEAVGAQNQEMKLKKF